MKSDGASPLIGFRPIHRSINLMGSLICPKPRRIGNINTHFNCLPLRNQAEVFIPKGVGAELIELIVKEGVLLGLFKNVDEYVSNPPKVVHFWRIQHPCSSNFGESQQDSDSITARQYASDLSSSPPFFSGSPPCRAMNPLIHDAQFANEKQHRLSSSPSPSTSSSPSSSCKGRCARARLGKPQSPNRIEGFDCLDSRMAAMA